MLSYALWFIVGAWLGIIYYFGRAGFGRANTQALIDKLRGSPRVWALLDRQHGRIRASFHYIEFGLCYLLLYLALCRAFLPWHYGRGLAVWAVTCLLALVDELHQKGSGGRCFRRIDLLHSMMGASLVMLVLFILG